MAEKNYIPSSIKRVETQYGDLFNVAYKVDELQAIAKKGWANITIAERREVSEKGATHYAVENTYEPEQKKEVKDNDDVPF